MVKTIVREERQPLFHDKHNPNHDIFVIPTQEGSDSDDQWNGSIGDATMEHIYNMRHKMPEMESFVHMANGNIFRLESNVAPPDEVGERSARRQIVQVMTAPTGPQFRKRNVTLEDKERVIEFLKEEIEENKRQKAEKMDALDNVLVSFDDWENMPQMTSVVDIPSTPMPLYIYAGNSKQMFYDFVPEDHPDLNKINNLLNRMNSIDWDYFSLDVVEDLRNAIFSQKWTHYTAAEELFAACEKIAETTSSPDDLIISALRNIEQDWNAIVYHGLLADRANDPVFKELESFEAALATAHSKGNLVWNLITNKGKELYARPQGMVTSAHWHKYQELRKRFSPSVVIGSVDLNKANMFQLRDVFKKKFAEDTDDTTLRQDKIEKAAQWVFFNRPFKGYKDLIKAGIINVSDINMDSKAGAFMALVKRAYRESVQFKNNFALNRVAQQVIKQQEANPKLFTEQEWFSVWQVYRICKETLDLQLQK